MADHTIRVLFVCLGNICRSPTAHGVMLRRLEEAGLDGRIEIDSAATHDYHTGLPPDDRAQAAARHRGVDLSGLRARPITAQDFARFDYVLAMDGENMAELRGICPPGYETRLRLFMEFARESDEREVPDPYYGGDTGFERVLDLVDEAALGLLDHLRRHHGL